MDMFREISTPYETDDYVVDDLMSDNEGLHFYLSTTRSRKRVKTTFRRVTSRDPIQDLYDSIFFRNFSTGVSQVTEHPLRLCLSLLLLHHSWDSFPPFPVTPLCVLSIDTKL